MEGDLLEICLSDVEGEVCTVNNVDPETISYDNLGRLVDRLQYGGGFKLYWRMLGKTLDIGLILMYNDFGVSEMLRVTSRVKKIEIYIEHLIHNPLQHILDSDEEQELLIQTRKRSDKLAAEVTLGKGKQPVMPEIEMAIGHGKHNEESAAEVDLGKGKQTAVSEEEMGLGQGKNNAESETELARGHEKQNAESEAEINREQEKHTADSEAEVSREKGKQTAEAEMHDDERGQMSEMDIEGPRDGDEQSCSSVFEDDDDFEEDDDTFFNVKPTQKIPTADNMEHDQKNKKFGTEHVPFDAKTDGSQMKNTSIGRKGKRKAVEEEDLGACDEIGITDVNSEYEDSDELNSLCSDDEDGEQRRDGFAEFNRNNDLSNSVISVGMKFTSLVDFRALLQEHAVKDGYDYRFVKSDSRELQLFVR